MDEALSMSQTNIDRHGVIRDVLEGRLTQVEAAQILDLGGRQVRRVCGKVRALGARGLIHGLLGRPSNNQTDSYLLERALCALQNPLWHDFRPTFARQKLETYHGIRIGEGPLRKLMSAIDMWNPRRRKPKHRAWRARRPCVGMLIQLDGSDHDWFEGRGPRCALLIFIDDATSRILYGEFITVEDTLNLMLTTRTYLKKWGRPVAFYVDKDSIYKINRQASIDEELRDEQPLTQFTRAMAELGIEVLAAHSPQAKGRVERGFGTHQDRLVKELRLRGISTMEEANKHLWEVYIPEHNHSYSLPPASETNVHKPLLASHRLNEILSLRTERTVAHDFTLRWSNQYLQILPSQGLRVRPKDKVLIERRLDGSTHLKFRGGYLDFKPIEKPTQRPSLAPRLAPVTVVAAATPTKPSSTHPWRRYGLRVAAPTLTGFVPEA